MEETLKAMKSLEWWVSVVVVSFTMSLLSAYMKSTLDRLFARFRRSSRRRNQEASAQRLQIVEAISGKPDQVTLVMLVAIQNRIKALGYLAYGILFTVSASAVRAVSMLGPPWLQRILFVLMLGVYILALHAIWRFGESWIRAGVMEQIAHRATKSDFLIEPPK